MVTRPNVCDLVLFVRKQVFYLLPRSDNSFKNLKLPVFPLLWASRSLCSCIFFVHAYRGHKRKLDEDDAASESSKESSNEDEEGSSSEADEMAAALEAELNDFM